MVSVFFIANQFHKRQSALFLQHYVHKLCFVNDTDQGHGKDEEDLEEIELEAGNKRSDRNEEEDDEYK